MELPDLEGDLKFDEHVVELVHAEDGGLLFASMQGD